MIVVQMSFTITIKDNHDLSYDWTRKVYIQPDWLSTSLCLSISYTKLTFQPITLDNDRKLGWYTCSITRAYSIAREEEVKQQPDQLQTQSQKARAALGDTIDLYRPHFSLNNYEHKGDRNKM